MGKIKRILPAILVVALLIISRFLNISWGLPYPMHPDERNMSLAIMGLTPVNFFKPDFFAYGQFPLYLGYLLIKIYQFFLSNIKLPINFIEATVSLRVISATASVINTYVLLKLVELLISNSKPKVKKFLQITNYKLLLISSLVMIFSPFSIQFSHFGTTESLLMLFYSLIVYLNLLYISKKIINLKFIIFNSLLCGLAIATKVSAVVFIAIPILGELTSLASFTSLDIKKFFFRIVKLTILALVVTAVFSPYNFISFTQFLGSMRYESDVALGRYIAFYTKQFADAIPLLFQFIKIFPYAFGWPVFIFFILGFVFLPWKNRSINFLRMTFLIYFLPNSFIFAKWTRFIAPVLPLMLVFAVFYLINLMIQIGRVSKALYCFAFFILILVLITPGIAYLSIYQNPDVRLTASDWVYKNIPNGSYVLAETANVVDIPIPTANTGFSSSNINYVSFNFYDVGENPLLQTELVEHLVRADYIFVPSRRIFANYTCDRHQNYIGDLDYFINSISYANNKCLLLEKQYPLLNTYYRKLFSGELGFKKVAEFTAYPKISLFDRTLWEFPDESAEESWTVFDHPVIRIFKKDTKYLL